MPPWGALPTIGNGQRTFGNQFMAMGGFAPPVWLSWFAADVDAAARRIPALGGDAGRGPYDLGTVGRQLDARDPAGHRFGLITLREPAPVDDHPGDPAFAELWGAEPDRVAPFYAELLALDATSHDHGVVLSCDGVPRLAIRRSDVAPSVPAWIPYFATTSVGGDLERARRCGAIVQVARHTVHAVGDVVVLADPANVYFGLVGPTA